MFRFLLMASSFIGFGLVCAAPEGLDEDNAADLPREYSGNYLVAAGTRSPNEGRIAVIYPKAELCADESDSRKNRQCKNYLVSLKPFRILAEIQTRFPHFQNKNHGGISADWSADGTIALVTLASKWGPADIILYEVQGDAVKRSTNLTDQMRDLLRPDFKAAKPQPYNETFEFIFEGESEDICRLEGTRQVRINALATTDPKHIGGLKAWDARLEGVWNISRARFSSQTVSRLFAGTRPEEQP